MKASDLLVRALELEGVTKIFGVPGEENLDFLESLRTSSIELILTRHEQGAGFMAATHGRLTGEPGVCMTTLGPGATNALTAVAYAHLGAMPMVVITGQKPLDNREQAAFQIIDVVGMMEPVSKMAEQITIADDIPYRVHEAFRVAKRESPGVVHLEIPEDVLQKDIDTELLTPLKTAISFASAAAVTEAAKIIEEAIFPLVMIGAGAKRHTTCKVLSHFIEHFKLPFFTTQMGKGVVDEESSYFLGTAALSKNDLLHQAIERADVVINIGHDIVEKPPFISKGGHQKIIHINYLPATTVEVYHPNHEVIGDITNSIKQLTHVLQASDKWDFSFCETLKAAQEKYVWNPEIEHAFPIRPQHLVRTVQDVVSENTLLTLDNGMYKIWFARNYKAQNQFSILLDNALATMGAGLPSAIGAKLTFPDKKVIAICGDGGFMMNPQELETAVRLGLDLVVFVINDSALGMIEWKQDDMGFPEYGLEFGNPDFVKLAEAYGATGHHVGSFEELAVKLEMAINLSGVHVINIPFDYSENDTVLEVQKQLEL